MQEFFLLWLSAAVRLLQILAADKLLSKSMSCNFMKCEVFVSTFTDSYHEESVKGLATCKPSASASRLESSFRHLHVVTSSCRWRVDIFLVQGLPTTCRYLFLILSR